MNSFVQSYMISLLSLFPCFSLFSSAPVRTSFDEVLSSAGEMLISALIESHVVSKCEAVLMRDLRIRGGLYHKVSSIPSIAQQKEETRAMFKEILKELHDVQVK